MDIFTKMLEYALANFGHHPNHIHGADNALILLEAFDLEGTDENFDLAMKVMALFAQRKDIDLL